MTQSRALIPEPPLLVLPSLALAVGLNEAIVLQQLHFLTHGRRPGRDGFKWVEMGNADMQHTFPFLSRNTLWRAVNVLRESGLIAVKETVGQPHAYRLDHDAINKVIEAGTLPKMGRVDTLPKMGRDPTQSGQGTLPKMGRDSIKEVLDSKNSIQQGAVDKSTKAKALPADWTPSESCRQQVMDAGYSLQFIRQVLPEFRMYWSAKGDTKESWDAVFALHVRAQAERKAARDRGAAEQVPRASAGTMHAGSYQRPATVETQQARQPPAAEVIAAFTPAKPLSAEENLARFEQMRAELKI